MVQELMCGNRERFGDVEQAEATFRAAESLDSSWPLTLMSLARYASNRADAIAEIRIRVAHAEELAEL